MSLKRVGHPLAFGIELVTPGIGLPVATATRSELPLSFGGKALARPLCVSHGIRPCDLNDGIFSLSAKIAVRTIGMAPIRAPHKPPPCEWICQRDRSGRWREDHSAGSQLAGQEVGKLFRVEWTLGNSHIASRLHESCEFLIRNVISIYPKSLHFHLMNRLSVLHVIGSHPEASARYPHHACRSIVRGGKPGRVENLRGLDQCRRVQGVTRNSAVALRWVADHDIRVQRSRRTIQCDPPNTQDE